VAKKSEAAPLESGATPGEVPPELAAKAQAEVESARAAPRQAEVIGNVNDAPKRKRGRPPGSKNKRPQAAPEPQELRDEGQDDEENEPATPEDMAELVDLFNLACVHMAVPPVEDDVRDEWAKKAARVANKWGGSLPLQAELTLLASTAIIFGPRVALMVDPAHQEQLRAAKAQEAERAANEERDRKHKAGHFTTN
jgi:hypothetical protein